MPRRPSSTGPGAGPVKRNKALPAPGLDGLLASLRRNKECVVHVEEIPERLPVHAEAEPELSPAMRAALPSGFHFYKHQADALAAAARRENVVAATGTSSGKSICYNVPVMERVLAEPEATALYLFPTRALAQDQLRALRELLARGRLEARVRALAYDGDTPDLERHRIREQRNANILISTPDMLHQAFLPWHNIHWAWFFQHLRFVVVDEVHTYRGIFGSHVANVFRRLRRVAEYHGASPQFIGCSATIANAKEFAERLCGGSFTLVDQDGSPQGPRSVLFWNPPLKPGPRGATRDKSFVHSARLFAEHASRGVRTLDFTRSRKLTERVFRAGQELLRRDSASLAERIKPYRAGYLAEERRAVEQGLFSGQLLGVVATNAMELGVDVGELEAAIITGFPGTVASFWQQAGRAGRSGRRALVTFVADDDAMNQYWMTHPAEFFARPHERAIINPDNPYVLDDHVACAIYEIPSKHAYLGVFGPAVEGACQRLEAKGFVRREGDRWRWTGAKSPAHSMNIRSIGARAYALVDERGRAIGEPVEEHRAFKDLHPGAVYYHMGDSYIVQDLDLEKRRIALASADVEHRTEPLSTTEVDILGEERTRKAGALQVKYGALHVTQRVTGYVIVATDGDALDVEPLNLPSTTLETKGLWYELGEHQAEALAKDGFDLAGSVHAAEHAMIGLTPLLAMCDRWDLGGVSYDAYPHTGLPTVFLYDGYPGGVGITETDFDHFDEISRMTLQLLRDCPCKAGCPACVHSPKCGNRNEPLDKHGAAQVLEYLTNAKAAGGGAPSGGTAPSTG